MKKKNVVYIQTPTVASRTKFMTAYRQCRKDILKFRFQLLISKFISHRHGRHSISAISKPIYITRRLHHRVCGRTSFVIRADFSPIAPALLPGEEERAGPKTEGKRGTERGADRICTVVSHVAPAETGGAARDSVRPSIRSSGHYRRVIIILRSATRSLAARVFHVPRFAPDEEEAEDVDAAGTRDTREKRKSGVLTRAGH